MCSKARFHVDVLNGKMTVDLLVRGIGQLCTVDAGEEDRKGPRRKAAMQELGIFADAVLAVSGDTIVAAGTEKEVLEKLFPDGLPERLAVVDAGGKAVIPGYVDPHTHAVFGKTRQDEYERRIRGETYLEIAAAGGGIHSSVADLRRREEDELTELAILRLKEMLAQGTTTVEIKSGYGLTLEDELKSLRAAKKAAQEVGIRSIRTCLAAHEMPKEYQNNRREYIRIITDEILIKAHAEGLATRCDVFCEPTVFDLEETLIILSRGRDLGMGLTVHADELASFGGAELAARLGAHSADHLIRIDEKGRAALAASDTVAVLLPGTVFTLGIKEFAPGRGMIDQGCAVALASDFNPGSSPINSMPLINAIACTQMRLQPDEALTASTLNSAWALGLAHEVGSLAPGKKADFLILDGVDYRLVPYRAGHNPVTAVYLGGKKV